MTCGDPISSVCMQNIDTHRYVHVRRLVHERNHEQSTSKMKRCLLLLHNDRPKLCGPDLQKAKAKRNRKRDPLFHVPKVVNKLGRKVDDNKDSLEVVDDFLGHVKREADWHHKNSMHIRAKEEHDGKCWERRKQGHEDIEDAFERKMKALARELQTHQGKISPSDTKLPETYSTYPPPDSCLDPQGVAAAATQAYFAHPLKAESPSRRELQQGTRERMLLYTGAKRDVNRHKKACSTVGAEDWHKQHIHTSDEFFRCRE